MPERIISSKVVGSADPLTQKVQNIKGAVTGIGCGVILLVVAMLLIYNSVFGVKENSKIVENLPLKKAAAVASNDNLVKIADTVSNTVPVGFAYNTCLDKFCTPGTVTAQNVTNVFSYSYTKQRFEIVKHVKTETRTTTFAGEETEQQVEVTTYTEEWVTKESGDGMSKFNLGNIVVEPGSAANVIIAPTSVEVPNVEITNLTPLDNYGQTPSAAVGNTKITINTIANFDGKSAIVVGKVTNSVIKEGDPFIVTLDSEQQLINALQTGETFERIALLIGSWLAIFIGLSMLLAPILELVTWIPLVGNVAKFAATAISFVIATIVVLSSYFLLTYWYLCVVALVVLIGLAIFLITKSKNKNIPAGKTLSEATAK